jgi:hypothetical protein
VTCRHVPYIGKTGRECVKCGDPMPEELEVAQDAHLRPADKWTLCQKSSCQRHQRCAYLNHPRCPYG